VLEKARTIDLQLYLKVVASCLDSCLGFVEVLTDKEQPSYLEKERAMNILFKLFLPLMDDYLHDEQEFISQACEKYINKWVRTLNQGIMVDLLLIRNNYYRKQQLLEHMLITLPLYLIKRERVLNGNVFIFFFPFVDFALIASWTLLLGNICLLSRR
jgi:hypothetical protein